MTQAQPSILHQQPASILLHMGYFSCKTAARPRPAASRRLGSAPSTGHVLLAGGKRDKASTHTRTHARSHRHTYRRTHTSLLFLFFCSRPASSSLHSACLPFPYFSGFFSDRLFAAEHLVMFPSDHRQGRAGSFALHDNWAVRGSA